MDYDYAVIGGGPVGLIAAQMLSSQHQKKVLLIDEFSKKSERFLGLSYGSIRRLADLKLSIPIEARINSLVMGHRDRLLYELQAADLDIPYLGINIAQHSLQECLAAQLDSAIDCLKAKVTHLEYQKKWLIKTDQEELVTARVLVGSDGVSSLTRGFISPPLKYDYAYKDVACSFKVHRKSTQIQKKAYQLTIDSFLLGLLPAFDESSYLVLSGNSAKIQSLTDYDLLAMLAGCPQLANEVFTSVERLSPVIALKSYHVLNQFKPNGMLFGLAAKSFHPVLAMGMNQNIFELTMMSHFMTRYASSIEEIPYKLLESVINKRCDRLRLASASLVFRYAQSLMTILPFSKIMVKQLIENLVL
jgi:2-polyprenyl-6-methoxyphenol hydroxylase-like FAD-dependent oxidoreductase